MRAVLNDKKWKKGVAAGAVILIVLVLLLVYKGIITRQERPLPSGETGTDVAGTTRTPEDLSAAKTPIQETYGSHILSVNERQGAQGQQLIIGLSLRDKEAPRIKKEIEAVHAAYVAFELVNTEPMVVIVTREDEDQYKLGLLFQFDLYEAGRLIKMEAPEPYIKRVSRSELENRVRDNIQYRVENTVRIVPIEKEFVEKGDLLKISFRVFDEKGDYAHASAETVLCGRVNFDRIIEESVEGKKVGETYIINYSPGGEGRKCEVTPLFCYVVEDYPSAEVYVKENTPYHSLPEYQEALMADEWSFQRAELWDEILLKMASASQFEMSEDVLAQKAAELYVSTRLLAEEFGVETEELVDKLYYGSTEDYILFCYKEARKKIQEYYLVLGIAQYANISVSEQEVREVCRNNGQEWTQLGREMQAQYSFELLREKVMEYMMVLE